MNFVYLQDKTTVSLKQSLLLILLLLVCTVEEKFNKIQICLKRKKKENSSQKTLSLSQDSEGPRHSNMGITRVNNPVALSLSKIQFYMIPV